MQLKPVKNQIINLGYIKYGSYFKHIIGEHKMKKEEMIATMTNRFEGMNTTGVEALFNIIMLIPAKERWMASTTPERIAELDTLKAQSELEEAKAKEQAQAEADQRAEEKRNQLYHDFAKMFDAIHTIDIPERYDIGTEEIKAIDFICGGVARCFPEYALSAASKYFSYGFANGMKYAKAQVKKAIKKEATELQFNDYPNISEGIENVEKSKWLR